MLSSAMCLVCSCWPCRGTVWRGVNGVEKQRVGDGKVAGKRRDTESGPGRTVADAVICCDGEMLCARPRAVRRALPSRAWLLVLLSVLFLPFSSFFGLLPEMVGCKKMELLAVAWHVRLKVLFRQLPALVVCSFHFRPKASNHWHDSKPLSLGPVDPVSFSFSTHVLEVLEVHPTHLPTYLGIYIPTC